MKGGTAGLMVGLSFCILALPPPAEGEQAGRMPRVGVLSPSVDSPPALLDTLRQGLRELGYIEGRNIVFDYRSAGGRTDRLPHLTAELIRLKVDVLVTTSSPGVHAAKQATGTIPIVMGGVDDAVEQGFVRSLASPGGNVTGVSLLNTELSPKRLQLLKETLPAVSRVAVLREAVGGASSVTAMEGGARVLGVQLQILELRDADELGSAFSAMTAEHAAALAVLPGPMVATQMRRIVDLAARNRLPAIFPDARFVEAGGLMSYGADLPEIYRRTAVYVDKVLKGARPADLPVEQPTRFELVANLKTARALRLAFPPSILVRTDRVIQ